MHKTQSNTKKTTYGLYLLFLCGRKLKLYEIDLQNSSNIADCLLVDTTKKQTH
jgi:hypothetical protein